MTQMNIIRMLAFLTLVALPSCRDDQPKTTYVVTYSGGLRPDGFADVATISGGPYYSAGAELVIYSSSDTSGSYSAAYGSEFFYGSVYYNGEGTFITQGDGSTGNWNTIVLNGQVLLSTQFGQFVIYL